MLNYKKLDDQSLAVYVREDNKEAYQEIVKRYLSKLLRYANYLVKNDDLAEDIVQESLIKAYKNLNAFNKKMSFSSWIYRIVHNEAINQIKKGRKTIFLNNEFEIEDKVNIEDDFIKKELHESLNNCLEKLSVKYKEPLILYFLEDKNYNEISDILRIPIGTVGTRINRGKGIIKKICQKKI